MKSVMKKQVAVLLAVLLIAVSMPIFSAAAGAVPISTKEQLNSIRNNLYGNYYLTQDIVFEQTDFAAGGAFYNNGAGFIPIGTQSAPFIGTLNGNGHTIVGLKINVYGTPKDLEEYTGDYIIRKKSAARAAASVKVEPTVGLFGYSRGTVENLAVAADIQAEGVGSNALYVGIIVGYNNGLIQNCAALGRAILRTKGAIGGIAGVNKAGSGSNASQISECYSTADVTALGNAYAGGLIGQTKNGNLDNSYFAGNVGSYSGYCGGLVGYAEGGKVENCLNVGTVMRDHSGLLLGYNNGTVLNDYYLAGNQAAIATDKKTTSVTIPCDVQQLSTQSYFSTLDFDSVWCMGDMYPVLQKAPVHTPFVTGLKLISKPYNTIYHPGDKLNANGLLLAAVYSDFTERMVQPDRLEGFDSTAVGTCVVTAFWENFSVQFTVSVIELVSLTELRMESGPDKTVYYIGEEFDPTGLRLTAVYSDGTEKTVAPTGFSGYDLSVPGEQTVTASFGDKTVEFHITVKEPVLTNLSVTKLPDKTNYYVGEALDTAGLQLTAVYDSGKTEQVQAEKFSGFDSQAVGTQTVTAHFGGLTADFTVTVQAVELLELELKSLPTQLKYLVGNPFYANGLSVLAHYNNGTVDVTEQVSLSAVEATAGPHTVTVSFGGKSVTFSVCYFTLGDVSGNGLVDLKDAALLAQYLAGFPVEVENICLDVNGDGVIDRLDVFKLVESVLENAIS